MIIKNIYNLLFFITILLIFASCKSKDNNQRIVSVSILPQKYLVERIAGDYVSVNVMIPPGMSPATCDLNTEQLKQLYNSELCFTIGHLPFETTHLYPVLESRKNIKVINHSKHLKLLNGSCGHEHSSDHEHGEGAGVDPHTWMSPANTKQMVAEICATLSEQYPEQKAQFESNRSDLYAEIDSIQNRLQQILSQKQHRVFLIYHPALTYLANDYGLEQVSIEDEGKEPHPAHLKKIIDLAREKDIRIIFIQSQFDSNNAKAIAGEINAEIIPIDPLAENWTAEMYRLIDIFEKKMQ